MSTPEPPQQPPPPGEYPPPPPQAPQAPQGYPPPQQYQTAPPNAPGAVAALVLGIVSIAACSICGPFAIWQGRKAERLVKEQGYGGGGMAKAGWIMGIIGTVLLALGLLYVVIVIIVAIADA